MGSGAYGPSGVQGQSPWPSVAICHRITMERRASLWFIGASNGGNRMRTVLAGAALILAPWGLAAGATPPAWSGYAGNAQHTAPAPAAAQNLTRIRWSTPVDLDPQYQDDELLIHYASPM